MKSLKNLFAHKKEILDFMKSKNIVFENIYVSPSTKEIYLNYELKYGPDTDKIIKEFKTLLKSFDIAFVKSTNTIRISAKYLNPKLMPKLHYYIISLLDTDYFFPYVEIDENKRSIRPAHLSEKEMLAVRKKLNYKKIDFDELYVFVENYAMPPTIDSASKALTDVFIKGTPKQVASLLKAFNQAVAKK